MIKLNLKEFLMSMMIIGMMIMMALGFCLWMKQQYHKAKFYSEARQFLEQHNTN